MGAVTLTRLVERARSRADMPIVGFVSAQELIDWINEGYQALHEKLVGAYGEGYVSSSAALTTSSGVAALPSNFFKMLSVETTIGGTVVTMLPYTLQERNAHRNAGWGNTKPRYALVGTNLSVLPVPANGTVINITYAHEITLLSGGSDTVSFPNGWEKYIVAYAAKQMLEKEESDTSSLSRLLKQWDDELEAMKFSRDAAAPKQAVDLDIVESYLPWEF